jgi:hypothetical protein
VSFQLPAFCVNEKQNCMCWCKTLQMFLVLLQNASWVDQGLVPTNMAELLDMLLMVSYHPNS